MIIQIIPLLIMLSAFLFIRHRFYRPYVNQRYVPGTKNTLATYVWKNNEIIHSTHVNVDINDDCSRFEIEAEELRKGKEFLANYKVLKVGE